MDKEFIQILAAALGVTDQESLQAKVQELGEEGLKTMYGYYQQIKESGADVNKSVELMKQAYNKITGVTMNKLGSKLNYIKKLRGECPEGYEAVKFAQGGQIKTECKKCGGNVTNKVKPTKARFAAKGTEVKYVKEEIDNTDYGKMSTLTHASRDPKTGRRRISTVTKELGPNGKTEWAAIDSLGNYLQGDRAEKYYKSVKGINNTNKKKR